MFYVYALKDPRTGLPFYIGKGKGNRAKHHLGKQARERTRNAYKNNKIDAIRDAGLEPEIDYLASNIACEDEALAIEESFIASFGRKGYDEGGILANVNFGGRPPCVRGMTYEQIYGSEEAAAAQIEKRRQLQLERGGYGPKKQSAETRAKISAAGMGRKLGPHKPERIEKMKRNRKKKLGADNPLSLHYELTSPDGQHYLLAGGDFSRFCKANGLSYATFYINLTKGRPITKRGKNQGWGLTCYKLDPDTGEKLNVRSLRQGEI